MDINIPFLVLAFLGSIMSASIGLGSGVIIVVFGTLIFRDMKSVIFFQKLLLLGRIVGVGNPVKAMFLSSAGFTTELFAGTMVMAIFVSRRFNYIEIWQKK